MYRDSRIAAYEKELAKIRAERDSLKAQLAKQRTYQRLRLGWPVIAFFSWAIFQTVIGVFYLFG